MPENIGEIMVAEILGTGTLILLGDGVVAGVLLNRSKAQNSGWIVITMAWAFAVFCGVIVAGPISGAHINPAVTFGLFLDETVGGNANALPGDQPALVMVAYWVAQMIGAFIGAVIVFLHYYPHWSQTEDADLKLAVYSTGPAIRNYPWNLVSEIIGTFVLMFVIFMFGVNAAASENPAGLASLGALPVALLVLVIGLALGGTTGYAINPARDLGPRIAHFLLPIAGKRDSDWAYSWVPVIGPLIGAAVAWVIYNFVVADYMAATIMGS
jgi:glycerol uptake facilitator protein